MAINDLPDSFQAGRIILTQEHPYLSAAVYRVIPIAKPGLGTMAVDQWWRLYFDPLCAWDARTAATVLYHEIGHLLRDHPKRAVGIDRANHAAWNIAADCEINDDVCSELGNRAKWPFPPCTPSSYKWPDGLTAEEYYVMIPKVNVSSGATGDKPKAGSGQCGSASGNKGQWEDGPPPGETDAATGEKGKQDAPPGLSDTEADMVRHVVAEAIQESIKSRGTVPEWLKRWAQTTLNPVVPWQKILAGMVRHAMADVAGMTNFTYQRPSRRATVTREIVFPALRKPTPNVAVVLDTSGSMGEDALSHILAEVSGILKSAGATGVDAIVTDASVKSARRVFKAGQIDLQGGGGTDMRVGIQHALSRPVKPHIIIVLTDGYTPWPDGPVGARVVAGIIGGHKTDVPSWIKRVDCQ